MPSLANHKTKYCSTNRLLILKYSVDNHEIKLSEGASNGSPIDPNDIFGLVYVDVLSCVTSGLSRVSPKLEIVALY